MSTAAPTVSTEAEYTIGTSVTGTDGDCGKLRRVIIDPVALALTHLVVQPRHESDTGHLVPIDLVKSKDEHGIHLGCTTTEFKGLEDAEEKKFLPREEGSYGYEQDQILSWPYYPVGGMGMGMGIGGLGGIGSPVPYSGPREVTSDHVPVGEVQVRRGQDVEATDGAIGVVKGLVIDTSNHAVTHVLLEEGHLWGKKTVGIPITAVKSVSTGITLTLSKADVAALPAIDLDRGD